MQYYLIQITSRTYIKKQTHEHWFFCHTKILEVESLNNNFGILLRILGSQKSLAELQQHYQPKQLHYSSLLLLFWSLTKTGSTIFCNIINIFCFFGGSGTKSSLLSITAFPRLERSGTRIHNCRCVVPYQNYYVLVSLLLHTPGGPSLRGSWSTVY